jgi:hypothetical protein
VTTPCDYVGVGGVGPAYIDGHCRCLVCARCGHHTGNSTQGHYWGWCKVSRTVREGHFCCPGDCELEAKS